MKSPSWPDDWTQPSESEYLAKFRFWVSHLEKMASFPFPWTSVWIPK